MSEKRSTFAVPENHVVSDVHRLLEVWPAPRAALHLQAVCRVRWVTMQVAQVDAGGVTPGALQVAVLRIGEVMVQPARGAEVLDPQVPVPVIQRLMNQGKSRPLLVPGLVVGDVVQ